MKSVPHYVELNADLRQYLFRQEDVRDDNDIGVRVINLSVHPDGDNLVFMAGVFVVLGVATGTLQRVPAFRFFHTPVRDIRSRNLTFILKDQSSRFDQAFVGIPHHMACFVHANRIDARIVPQNQLLGGVNPDRHHF